MSPARRSRGRFIACVALSFALMSAGALATFVIALPTIFMARRLYAGIAAWLARGVLAIWGVTLVVRPARRFPTGQVVWVSNHPSTLDVFVLIALGLPNTRYFLSGYLRWYGPFGVLAMLMGTFFTVTQDRPAERVRIFMRAERILRRTGESVYLSPEGQRTIGGVIGPFNKGAFHLATALGVPIVPLYFDVPPEVDPGMGFDIGAGTVTVDVKPPVQTRDWRVEDAVRHKEQVRDLFVEWHALARTEAGHAG